MHYNIEFKLQNLLSNIVGLKYIDYEKLQRALLYIEEKIKIKDHFEMAFMKRFNEEKMPTALSMKDGPCPDFSSTSSNIICIDKQKIF